ncbi:gp53-like domain-containing protein [Nitrincola iocasae]|uniref:Uncharacterized protein n=1 Tax=Nitrincola iocasae TaxID=2614693 RepID=A0A5J6LDN7_9GAMM|nr:phage tail protein [Nitrincola iocasae]QEW06352.1 hypothetical protein F5I99_07450 [Nitrincola iocasae]
MVLQITITDAGRAEVINADNTGTGPVTITEVGLGTGQYNPDPEQLTLTAETKRLNTIAGQVVSADIIHVTIKDETGDAYTVNEFGLYTDSGTLFAVYSDPENPIAQKASASALLLAVDITLGTLNANSLTFGDTSFAMPPASETVPGIAQAATQVETDEGTNDTKFITAKKLKNWVKQATESVLGMMKVATQAQTDEGTDDTVAVTPKKLRWGFSILLGGNGYIVFPSWMGGLIFQWGAVVIQSGNFVDVILPITFPTGIFRSTQGTQAISNLSSARSVGLQQINTSTLRVYAYSTGGENTTVEWIAIGK